MEKSSIYVLNLNDGGFSEKEKVRMISALKTLVQDMNTVLSRITHLVMEHHGNLKREGEKSDVVDDLYGVRVAMTHNPAEAPLYHRWEIIASSGDKTLAVEIAIPTHFPTPS